VGDKGPTGDAGSAGASAQFISVGANASSGQCLGAFNDAHVACSATMLTNALDMLQVPAAGATVSNLVAETNTAPASGQSYTVEVLDNGSAIYSCSVTAGNTTCSSTASGVAVTAGHRLQVKITNVGGAPNKLWRVAFRY
jgi:hypothetical protein